MSFAALLRAEHADCDVAASKRKKKHKYNKRSVESNIYFGERVANFMLSIYGEERSKAILQKVAQRASGSQPSARDSRLSLAFRSEVVDLVDDDCSDSACKGGAIVPYGFWTRFFEEDLGELKTHRKRQQLLRAFQFYAMRKQDGANTLAAMRGMRE